MTGADFLAAELARIAYIDGHEEGLKGMLGVAFTIRNRVNAGWDGGDWQKVISSSVTSYRASLKPFTFDVPDPRNFTFQSLLQEITGIFHGFRDDDVTVLKEPFGAAPTIGVGIQRQQVALFYGRFEDLSNPWFVETISRNVEQHRLIAQVGLMGFWS